MASPAYIIRACLVEAGAVAMPPDGPSPAYTPEPGDDLTLCFVPSLPDEVDQAVAISNEVGRYFGREMTVGKGMVHCGIKLFVRFPEEEAGHDFAVSMILALRAIKNKTIAVDGTTHYIQSVYVPGTLIPLGEEQGRQRQMWTIHARVAFKEQEPTLG